MIISYFSRARNLKSTFSLISRIGVPNYSTVYGDWKDFTFKKATLKDDYEGICMHVRNNFLKEEMMNKLLGHEDENVKDYNRLIQVALGHDISMTVTRKDSQEILGVNLMMDSRREGYGFPNFTPQSTNLPKIFGILHELEHKTEDNFSQKFNAQVFGEIFIISVESKLNREGIGLEILRRGLVLLKANGFKAVRTSCCSNGATTGAVKCGFQELGSITYREYKDESGTRVFSNAEEGEKVTALGMVL